LLIIPYFEAFFVKERMNISDSLHKMRISHRMSFSHYKQNTCVSQIKMAARQTNTFSTLVLKVGTIFLTAALRKTEATPRSAEQLPQ
jgi:succinyl-CoA synthetase beta subunit